MAFRSANFFKGTLQQSVSAAAVTCFIEPAVEALLPALGVGDAVKAILYDQSQAPEIVEITAHAAGQLTITRAREGTAALAWPAGTIITHDLTAEMVEALAAVAASSSSFIGMAAGTNAITVTLAPASPVPVPNNGDEVVFSVAANNTGATTLTVTNGSASIGPTALVHQDNSSLEDGDLVAGWPVTVRFSSALAKWVLITRGSFHTEVDQINDGPLVPANHLSNHDFSIWDGGTPLVDPISGTFTANGYYIEYDGTIGNFTISRQKFAAGQTDVGGGPDYFLRWAHTAAGVGSTFRRLRVKATRVQRLSGRKVVRSIYMKADSARNVTGKLIQHFGTGGAPSADVEAASVVFNLTADWQRFQLPSTLPSIAGKTLGTNDDDALILSLDLPLNTTMSIEFAMDQLEEGSRATLPGGVNLNLDSLLTQAEFDAGNPDLAAIELLGGLGLLTRTGAAVWATRSLAVGVGLTVANPSGTAGNPSVGLDTALAAYVADPLSVAELASITAPFDTAAFVADAGLVHIAGLETITGQKTFSADGAIIIEHATPRMLFRETDAGADEKLWDILIGTTNMLFRTRTDADGAGVTALTFDRGAGTAITSATFGTPVIVPDGSAAAPGLRVTSEATGLYRSSSTALGFAAAGTEVATISTTVANFSNLTRVLFNPGSAASPSVVVRSADTNSGRYSIADDNPAESTGGTLRFDWNTARLLFASTFDAVLGSGATEQSSAYSVGYRGTPPITTNAVYAFPRADAGSTIYHDETSARTWTIPANGSVPHPIGTAFVIDNTGHSGGAPGAITVAITTDELRRGDGTAGTGSRVVPADGVATIRKVTATRWVITGIFT